MQTIIHIAMAVADDDLVSSTVTNCCSETGDELIGRRVYEESGEVLLVVRLVQDYNVSKHIPILSQALQKNLLLSFQIEKTNLVLAHCTEPLDIRTVMKSFPLGLGESWFPAIASAQRAYVCARSSPLPPNQEQWFEKHHLNSTYCR